MNNPIATILMEDGKKMTAELYPEKAPNTVNNFIAPAMRSRANLPPTASPRTT